VAIPKLISVNPMLFSDLFNAFGSLSTFASKEESQA